MSRIENEQTDKILACERCGNEQVEIRMVLRKDRVKVPTEVYCDRCGNSWILPERETIAEHQWESK